MTTQAVIDAITQAAQTYGVNPRLALAVAYNESSLNPLAIGDNGTSFGLYQLHQGGELGALTPAQAFNPVTNANVALAQIGAVAAANPGLDPGVIAADAQRPANPTAYAAAIDALYNSPTFMSQLTSVGSSIGSAAGTAIAGRSGAGIGGAIGGAVQGVISGGLTGGISSGIKSIVITALLVAGGIGLIVLGLARLFPGVTRTIASTAGTAAGAALKAP